MIPPNAKMEIELGELVELLDKAKLLEVLQSRSCEGCKHEQEKIKLHKYNCAPYPCRECARHTSDKWEAKE